MGSLFGNRIIPGKGRSCAFAHGCAQYLLDTEHQYLPIPISSGVRLEFIRKALGKSTVQAEATDLEERFPGGPGTSIEVTQACQGTGSMGYCGNCAEVLIAVCGPSTDSFSRE